MKTVNFFDMLMLYTLAVILACTGAAIAFETCRTRPSYNPTQGYTQPSYTEPSFQHEHVSRRRLRVDIVQVAQINPAYSSAYSPDGYDSSTQTEILAELRRLGVRLETQERIAQALRQNPQAQQPAAVMPKAAEQIPAPIPVGKAGGGGAAAGLAVMASHCAVCHQAGKTAPDQRFTLLDMKGSLAPLTAAQKLKVVQKAYAGQMPPPLNTQGMQPLTDADFAALMDALQ